MADWVHCEFKKERLSAIFEAKLAVPLHRELCFLSKLRADSTCGFTNKWFY